MACTQHKDRNSKNACYHCASLMGYHSCIHMDTGAYSQSKPKQNKALITSRTTGLWQIFWQKMSQSKERRKFQVHTKSYSLRPFPCFAIICWLLRNKHRLVPQKQLVHASSSWLKKLQSHHSEKLRPEELLPALGCVTENRETALKTTTDRNHSGTSNN